MSSWSEGVAREIPTGLSGSFFVQLEDAWEAVGDEYQRSHLNEVELEDVESRLRAFDVFAEGNGLPLLDAWRVGRGDVELTICLLIREYSHEEQGTGAPRIVTSHDCYMAAHYPLPEDLGKVLMRPETLSDKLLELFRRREVDFDECPQFSERYYVLATDEDRLRKGISQQLLEHLGSRHDIFAEISGRDMVVLWPEALDEDSALAASDFFSRLAPYIAPAGSPYR